MMLARLTPDDDGPRAALGRHLRRLEAAKSDLSDARAPADRLRARIEAAQAAVREAESQIAGLVEAEAAALSAWAERGTSAPPPATQARARTEAELHATVARYAARSAERALQDATAREADAAKLLDSVERETTAHVLAVLVDTGQDVIDRLRAARLAASTTEAEAVGLIEALGRAGRALPVGSDEALVHLRAAEKLNAWLSAALISEATPGEIERAVAQWSALATRLASDPAADLEEHAA